jgi:hypothetical protein
LGRADALRRRVAVLAPSFDAMRKSLDRQSADAAANGLAVEVDRIERSVAAYRGKLQQQEQRIAE